MRLVKVDYAMMKNAGFRMVLFGIESANQYTLDRIKKGTNADEIIPVLKKASEAGLEPHGAFMFGYPWETAEDEDRTLNLCIELLRKGYLKTAQASLYKGPEKTYVDRGNVKKIYSAAHYPDFWINQLRDIKDFQDFKYLLRKIKAGLWR
jgi:radical SAM superfamily enzyme